MNTLPSSAPRLLAGFGTAALVAAVGLFASSRPAHTAGGPIPVTVSNAPLEVVSQASDNPALQPFQVSENFTPELKSEADSKEVEVTGLTLRVPVPNEISSTGSGSSAGKSSKRLVLQEISVGRAELLVTDPPLVTVTTTADGVTATHTLGLLQLAAAPPSGSKVGSTTLFTGELQPVTLYADGGTDVIVQISGANPKATLQTTIVNVAPSSVPGSVSGYLADVP